CSRLSSIPKLSRTASSVSWCLRSPNVMARKKLHAHRQLVSCQSQRLARDRFRHTVQLKEDIAGPHGGDPGLRLAFTLAHASFRWPRRYRFIRENTDPQFSLALHIAGERDPRGFQLRIG